MPHRARFLRSRSGDATAAICGGTLLPTAGCVRSRPPPITPRCLVVYGSHVTYGLSHLPSCTFCAGYTTHDLWNIPAAPHTTPPPPHHHLPAYILAAGGAPTARHYHPHSFAVFWRQHHMVASPPALLERAAPAGTFQRHGQQYHTLPPTRSSSLRLPLPGRDSPAPSLPPACYSI